MLLILGKCDKNFDAAVRLYSRQYSNRITPSNWAFTKLEKEFTRFWAIQKKKSWTSNCNNIITDNETALIEIVTEILYVSQRQIARQMEISLASVFNI